MSKKIEIFSENLDLFEFIFENNSLEEKLFYALFSFRLIPFQQSQRHLVYDLSYSNYCTSVFGISTISNNSLG